MLRIIKHLFNFLMGKYGWVSPRKIYGDILYIWKTRNDDPSRRADPVEALDSRVMRMTAEQMLEMRARGESKTDLQKVRGKSQEQLESDIDSFGEEDGIPPDWMKTSVAIIKKDLKNYWDKQKK